MNNELIAFMSALAEQESGYDPTAISSLGARGIFQIMPKNWPIWAKEAGLGFDASPTIENQYIVAGNKILEYYNRFGSWRDVASAWYSGQEELKAKILKGYLTPYEHGPSIKKYIDSIMLRMEKQKRMSDRSRLADCADPIRSWISISDNSSPGDSGFTPSCALKDFASRMMGIGNNAPIVTHIITLTDSIKVGIYENRLVEILS